MPYSFPVTGYEHSPMGMQTQYLFSKPKHLPFEHVILYMHVARSMFQKLPSEHDPDSMYQNWPVLQITWTVLKLYNINTNSIMLILQKCANGG